MAATADPIAYAAGSPEASLLIRQILQAATQRAAAAKPPWLADAFALLANVLINDFLNWWNEALPGTDVADRTLADANTAITQAFELKDNLALAYHARGLVKRAQGDPKGALADFEDAVRLDPNFARAYAQVGNQKALLGNPQKSHSDFAIARSLAVGSSGTGYIDWAEGRAFFEEENWVPAINLLEQSVVELPTVYFNRLYLAAAQNNSPDDVTRLAARRTVYDFIDRFHRDTLDLAKNFLTRPGASKSVTTARETVRSYISQF